MGMIRLLSILILLATGLSAATFDNAFTTNASAITALNRVLPAASASNFLSGNDPGLYRRWAAPSGGTLWFFDDFRRTNFSGSNFGVSLSGHYYSNVVAAANNAAWMTNLLCTNGYLTCLEGAAYPAPVSGFSAIYCCYGVTNGIPNLFGLTMEVLPTTNGSGGRATTILYCQQETIIQSGVIYIGSNFVHCGLYANIPAGSSTLQVSIGTPGVVGVGGFQLLLNKDLTLRGKNEFSMQFMGHNVLVVNVGTNTFTMTHPLIDACRGTNGFWEFNSELTNNVNGVVAIDNVYAGLIPTTPDFYPSYTTNVAAASAATVTVITNAFTDSVVGVPAGAAATNRTVRLRPAALMPGRELTFIDFNNSADGTNIILLPDGSEKFNGVLTSTNITTKGGSIRLISDGVNWHILSRY